MIILFRLLCTLFQELNDLGEVSNAFPPTPELERITYYPNYPVGPKGGDD